jgi:arylsulfatase A-like enzyme
MKALDEAGVGDDTLVIFSSDNGGVHVGNKLAKWPSVPEPYEHLVKLVWEAQEKGLEPNGKFRSGKSTIHQGGFRVPFIARWPGRVPAGAESGQTICLVDVMATIAEMTGLPLPKPDVGCEDSFSFLPNLLGKSDAPSRDALVMQNLWGTYAVRKGNWKWIEGVPGMITRNGKWVKIHELPENERAALDFSKDEALYDLSKDPGEKQNVLKAQPEVVKELRAILNETRKGHSRKQ